MKSYKYLWDDFISDDNIKLAFKNASRGKLKRKRVYKYKFNEDYMLKYFKEYANNYKNHKHTPKEIYDGISRKKRTIIVPTFEELVIQHMAVNVLKPIFMKPMYYHSYGSIPGRGVHSGAKTVKKWIKNGGRHIKYCLQLDIKKYFNNVPHDVLVSKLSRIIKDKKLMKVLTEIINVNDIGIPLGFYTSQWFANFYLTELDHVIKEQWSAKYYIRYMDDMVIFGSNKKELHKLKDKIEKFLNEELGLELKANWQVFRFSYGKDKGRPLNFMGFVFHRNRTCLRKSILRKMLRKARKIGKKDKPTIYDCKQMLSYLGWIKSCDVYGIYEREIKPYVNFKDLKRRVSNYDRKQNKK